MFWFVKTPMGDWYVLCNRESDEKGYDGREATRLRFKSWRCDP